MREVYASEELWLQARPTFLGASEMAGILGLGFADQSMITIWDSKVHGGVDAPERKRLTIGSKLEPVLRQMFELETGMAIEFTPYDVRRHPDYPWMGATLDGETCQETGEKVPVELKNVGFFRRKDWEDEIPLKYEIQVQYQMAVTGASHAYLFALIGGNETSTKLIPRNERLIEGLIRRARNFWEYVENNELPPVDGSEATAKALSRIWTEVEGLSVLLPEEAQQWAEKLEAAKELRKTAEAEEEEYSNLLKAAIGEASFGDIPGWGRYSFKTQTRKEHWVKASTFRVLRRVKT